MDDLAKVPAKHGGYCQMQVACPHCGTRSSVAWGRLDSPLHCKTCATWLRLDGSGRLVETAAPTRFSVQVRSSFSGWTRVRVLLSTNRPLGQLAARGWWRHLLALAAGLAAMAMFAGVFTAAPRSEQTATVVDAAPPTSLDARVADWGEAWLSRDVARLLQLVERSRDRELRRWVLNHPPPDAAGGTAGDSPHFEVTSVVRSEGYLADVTFTVRCGEKLGSKPLFVLKQLWHQREGAWYFWPAL